MKNLKFTFLLTALLSMVGTRALAHDIEVANAEGVTIYYNWAKNQTELSVSYRGNYYSSYSDEYSGNVVIPESVIYNGVTYPVTNIGESAFSGCSGLTSVTIPNSVTSIGSGAFYGCLFTRENFVNNSTLTSENNWGATLCDKETEDGLLINNNSVVKCRKWANSVSIPNSVTSIGYHAFSGCSGLTSVTIGNSVTSIGDQAFSGCSGLTSVTIGNSVTSIGYNAFNGCKGLTSVSIPNSVTSIGSSAFQNCSGLTSVTVGNSVTSIGGSAFLGCSGLTSITIPNSVTYIGNSAFYNCI